MSTNERILLVASLATVFALVTRNDKLQLLAALTGGLFAILNARDMLAKVTT
jgi:hypothetical protein